MYKRQLADCWVWDFIVFNNTAPVMRGLTSGYTSQLPRLTNNLTALCGHLYAAHTFGAAPAVCPSVSQGDSRFFLIQYRVATA